MTVIRVGLVGAFVAAVFAAPVAEAAEVRLERQYFDCSRMMCPPEYGELLVVRGDRGEANRLTVGRGAAGEFRVTDAGGALRVGPGCTLEGERSVVCPTSAPRLWVFVFAGDRNDTVTSSVTVDGVDGGSGNDRLAGSSFADALYGGQGRDVLRGNDGNDVLHDGRPTGAIPPDQFEGRFVTPEFGPSAPVAADRDLFDGGAGTDTLSYEGRRRGVFADLARTDRHAGAPGERDSLRELEWLEGGNGGDLLFGDDATNALLGAGGDDVLIGRAGDDDLQLGGGSNRARGGVGDDTIGAMRANLLEPQRVVCGLGDDRVADLFRNDYAEEDCETIVIAETHELETQLPPASWERPPLATYSATVVDCEAPSCRLSLDATVARSPNPRLAHIEGLLLGRATTTIPYRGLTELTVHLSDRGGRLLRRYRALLIRIHLKIVRSDDPNIRAAGAYLTRLRAPAL